MNPKEGLLKKLYQTINIVICDSKVARTYGTEHKLTYSDICLLKCTKHNKGEKASRISKYLGITNGAVAQLAKKLEEKGYLEPYRITGNKKEVYYRLTESGEAACRRYDQHYGTIRDNVEKYINTLDDDTALKIIGLFDVLASNTQTFGNCSIKHSEDQTGQAEKTEIKRCEKCQRIY